jgi:hypothetical protein
MIKSDKLLVVVGWGAVCGVDGNWCEMREKIDRDIWGIGRKTRSSLIVRKMLHETLVKLFRSALRCGKSEIRFRDDTGRVFIRCTTDGIPNRARVNSVIVNGIEICSDLRSSSLVVLCKKLVDQISGRGLKVVSVIHDGRHVHEAFL